MDLLVQVPNFPYNTVQPKMKKNTRSFASLVINAPPSEMAVATMSRSPGSF